MNTAQGFMTRRLHGFTRLIYLLKCFRSKAHMLMQRIIRFITSTTWDWGQKNGGRVSWVGLMYMLGAEQGMEIIKLLDRTEKKERFFIQRNIQ